MKTSFSNILDSLGGLMERSKTFIIRTGILATILFNVLTSSAQERWFKIEVSIFTNENSNDRDSEIWLPQRSNLSFPGNLLRLKELSDVLIPESMLPEPLDETETITSDPSAASLGNELSTTPDSIIEESDQRRQALLELVRPKPAREGEPYRFIDPSRDAFVRLPNSESDFGQTNRAITRSADHRLLFHGIWQQSVVSETEAIPIFIEGGERYGEHAELEGSLTIRFNDNADRVVLDTNLWLTEFTQEAAGSAPVRSIVKESNPAWLLPNPPPQVLNSPRQQFELSMNPATADGSELEIARIYSMKQSRAMRSTEFHYLDHPALGVVVLVEPFEVPALPELVEEALLPIEQESEIAPDENN